MSNSSYGSKGQSISDVLIIKDKIVLSKKLNEMNRAIDSPILLANPFYGVVGDGTTDLEYLSLNQYIHKFSGDSAWILFNNYMKTFENDINIFIGNNYSSQNIAYNDTKLFTQVSGVNTYRESSLLQGSNYIQPLNTDINDNNFKMYIRAGRNSNGIFSSGKSVFSDINVLGNTKCYKLDISGVSTLYGASILGSTLEVSKKTSLKNILEVDDNTSLKSLLTVGKSCTLNSTLHVEKEATFNSSLTVKSLNLTEGIESGSLIVTNSATIDSLNVGDSSLIKGNLEVVKSTTIGGTLSIDKLVITSKLLESSGSYVLSTDDTLGSLEWKKIDALTNLDNISSFGTGVDAPDSINIGKSGNQSLITIYGNSTISKSLQVKENIIAEGITNLKSNLTVSGDTSLSNLSVGKNTTLVGSVSLKDTLNIVKAVTMDSTLHVTNNLTLGGNISNGTHTYTLPSDKGGTVAMISDVSSLSDSANLSGSTTLGSTLYVSKSATIKGFTSLDSKLNVKKEATFNSTVMVDGTLDVSGAVTIDSTLHVVKNLTLVGNISNGTHTYTLPSDKGGTLAMMSDVSTLSGSASLSGSTTLGSTLYVSKSATIKGFTSLDSKLNVKKEATFNSTVMVDGTLDVSGAVTMDSTLHVGKNLTLVGNISNGTHTYTLPSDKGGTLAMMSDVSTLSGSTTLNSTLYVSKSCTIKGLTSLDSKLNVKKEATFNSTVIVDGTLNVSGAVTMGSTLHAAGNITTNTINLGNGELKNNAPPALGNLLCLSAMAEDAYILLEQSGKTAYWGAGVPTYDVKSAQGALTYVRGSPVEWRFTNRSSIYQRYASLHIGTNGIGTSTFQFSSSDDRLKINEELIENATDTIMKLRPQKYDKYDYLESEMNNPINEPDKKVNTLRHEWGFIAQEVYYECPELRKLVGVPSTATLIDDDENKDFEDINNDPNYSNWGDEKASLHYNSFIALLTKGFQEQQEEIKRIGRQQILDKEMISKLEDENLQKKTELDILKTEVASYKSILDKLTTSSSFAEFKKSL